MMGSFYSSVLLPLLPLACRLQHNSVLNFSAEIVKMTRGYLVTLQTVNTPCLLQKECKAFFAPSSSQSTRSQHARNVRNSLERGGSKPPNPGESEGCRGWEGGEGVLTVGL